MAGTKTLLGGAARNEHGSIAVITAVSFAVILLCVGASIDFLRWHQARQVTNAALDAAVLAGGLELQIDPVNIGNAVAVARKTYRAGISQRLPVAVDTVDFSLSDSNQTITASGHAEMATTILNMFGYTQLGLMSASKTDMPSAQVTTGGPGGSNLEVAMMLDVTGSMCDDGAGPCTSGAKISVLKAAATNLVNIVVRSNQSEHTSKVAMVPFSTRVRVSPDGNGAGLMKALTNLDSPQSFWYDNCLSWTGSGGSESAGNWSCTSFAAAQAFSWPIMPCVTERFNTGTNTYDLTDDAPGAGKWLNAHAGNRWPLSNDSTDTAMTAGLGATAADLAGQWNYDSGAGVCADVYAGSEIVPLTSDKPNLLNHINSLQAYGGTAGLLATSWSWYMLSPKWDAVWTGESAPAPYSDLTATLPSGAPKLRKVAIMMTDGGYNVLLGNKGQDQQTVSNEAVAVCQAMKSKGIEIYTVGFMLNSLSASEATIARSTLTACGTDIQHFYDSLTEGDLKTAFHEIGVKLSGLRLMR